MFVNCFLPFALAHRVSVTIQKILLFPILCCYFGHLSQIFIKPFVKNHTFNLYFSFPLPHNSEQVHGTHLGDSKYSGSFLSFTPICPRCFYARHLQCWLLSLSCYKSTLTKALWCTVHRTSPVVVKLCSPERYIQYQSLGHVNMLLFRNRVIGELIRLR